MVSMLFSKFSSVINSALPVSQCQKLQRPYVVVQAAQFARGSDFASAKQTTIACGISSLLPKATVDDFVFDPCGYSMNGLEGSAFSTIHVTPQQDCSYASLELYGYTADQLDPTAVAEKVSFGATSTENVIWHSNCVLSHPPAKESVH